MISSIYLENFRFDPEDESLWSQSSRIRKWIDNQTRVAFHTKQIETIECWWTLDVVKQGCMWRESWNNKLAKWILRRIFHVPHNWRWTPWFRARFVIDGTTQFWNSFEWNLIARRKKLKSEKDFWRNYIRRTKSRGIGGSIVGPGRMHRKVRNFAKHKSGFLISTIRAKEICCANHFPRSLRQVLSGL